MVTKKYLSLYVERYFERLGNNEAFRPYYFTNIHYLESIIPDSYYD